MSAGEHSRPAILTHVKADPKKPRAPYSLDNGIGLVTVFQANFVMIGTRGDEDDVPTTVSVMTGANGCGCGCAMKGRAFEYHPTPEQARMLARQLIEAADQVDAAAHAQAADFIGKVRKL